MLNLFTDKSVKKISLSSPLQQRAGLTMVQRIILCPRNSRACMYFGHWMGLMVWSVGSLPTFSNANTNDFMSISDADVSSHSHTGTGTKWQKVNGPSALLSTSEELKEFNNTIKDLLKSKSDRSDRNGQAPLSIEWRWWLLIRSRRAPGSSNHDDWSLQAWSWCCQCLHVNSNANAS